MCSNLYLPAYTYLLLSLPMLAFDGGRKVTFSPKFVSIVEATLQTCAAEVKNVQARCYAASVLSKHGDHKCKSQDKEATLQAETLPKSNLALVHVAMAACSFRQYFGTSCVQVQGA